MKKAGFTMTDMPQLWNDLRTNEGKEVEGVDLWSKRF
jgi:hypothetical protein